MEIIKLIGIGIILGISNVIPGVSGGTMAVVFDIYDRLISLISLNIKKIFSMWKFWLPLAAGLSIGILLFSKFITYLFNNYPMAANWFFIGLICGSLPLILKKLQSSVNNSKSFPPSIILSCLIALALMIGMHAIQRNIGSGSAERILTAGLFIKLFFAAILAAAAMIIPGISGAFLMLILGVYSTVISAVSELNIPVLLPVALGVIAGLLGGAGLVRFLMNKIPAQTYAAILGLVAGSLVIIFPGITLSLEMLVSIFSFLGGFSLAFFSSLNLNKQKNP